jgi:ABC-2 type transport system permease protein
MIVNNERKYGLNKRIGLSKASSLTLFIGKLIPAVLAVAVETGIAAVVSTILMDINWGDSPLLSAGILFLEIIAVAALGITVSLLIKSQALSNVIMFISGFLLGFVGGSFQTYMLNFVSDNLAKLSPLYYINRTLVEFSTKGYSDYVNSCIVFLVAIALISTILGVAITAKERIAV